MHTAHELDAGQIYRKAALLGIATGLRSMTPLAVLSRTIGRQPLRQKTSLRFLSAPSFRNITSLAVLGELIGDKLPRTPPRVKAGPLLGRLAVGALSGALFCRYYNQSSLSGAIAGASGAAFGTFTGYAGRVLLSQLTNVPDVIWGLAEDAIAGSLAMAAAHEAGS